MPTEPYISINKLAEYTQAKASRRKQIIKTLKDDSDFFKVYYQGIKVVLPKYFKSGYDEKILKRAIKNEAAKEITTAWTVVDRDNTVIALQSLLDTELPDLSDYDIFEELPKVDNIVLSNLKVTIKPELYLRHKITGKVGAVKFHLSKTESNRLDLNAMQHAATLIKFALMEHGHDIKNIDNNACLSIDIFAKNYANSPVAYKRTLDALSCSCEEILSRWDSI